MQTCNESLNQPGFKLNPTLFVATRIQRRLRSALYAATFRTSSSPATFASVRTPITAIAASLDPTASSTTRGASRSSRLSQGNSSRRGHTSLHPRVSLLFLRILTNKTLMNFSCASKRLWKMPLKLLDMNKL